MQREAAVQERMRLAVERSLAPRLAREFNRTAVAASKAYRASASVEAVDLAMQGHADRLAKLLRRAYAPTIQQTADRVADEAKKLKPKGGDPRLEQKDEQGVVDTLIKDWILTTAFEHATSMAKTSQDLVRSAVLDSVQSGLGEVEVGKAIREALGGSISVQRSRLIARTETHTAAQQASLAVVDSLDLPPTKKRWVPVSDARTREHHREMRGKPAIERDEAFQVGGHALQYPGDENGPASEVINCRCVMVYDVDVEAML